jgi:hypothetical protein
LLTHRHDESLVILDLKLDQTDPAASVNHFCGRLEEVPRSTRSQKVDILLKRNRWFAKAISCGFTSLVSDGEDSGSMGHLIDIDSFVSNGKSGAGETREKFDEFHPDSLGEGIFATHFFENDVEDIFRVFIHLDFSSLAEDLLIAELFFLACR